MRRAGFVLLFAMAALGCAEQPLPPEAQPVTQAPVPDVQITQLYPNDLPGPPGPGGVAIAPAQPSERTQAVAAGFNASKASVRANAPGDVARMRLVWIPDAPSQRCVTGRSVLQGQGRFHAACSTGVAGQELRVRVTAAFREGDSGRLFELEGEVARLIAEVTRAAAGLQPNPGVRSDGRVFIPRFGPEAAF
jgi:hypothetical protein